MAVQLALENELHSIVFHSPRLGGDASLVVALSYLEKIVSYLLLLDQPLHHLLSSLNRSFGPNREVDYRRSQVPPQPLAISVFHSNMEIE